MNSREAHVVERPFLMHWPSADVQIDWHMNRVLVELGDDDEIDFSAMRMLVNEFGAKNLSVQAFANAGCGARLRIVARLERDE